MVRLPRLGFALRLAAALLALNLPSAVSSAAPLAVPLAQPPAAPSPAITGLDAPPGCSFTYASKSDSVPQAINDNSTITRTLSFSGLPQTLWQASVRTQISHTYAADLDMYLVGPAPYFRSATLTTDNGGGA